MRKIFSILAALTLSVGLWAEDIPNNQLWYTTSDGKYDSAEDFAEYLCEECGYFKNLPQWLQCCIDYTAVWRNLDTAGDYTEVDDYIFRA